MLETYTCVLQEDAVTTICTGAYPVVGYHDWLLVNSVIVFCLFLLVLPILFKPVRELFQ